MQFLLSTILGENVITKWKKFSCETFHPSGHNQTKFAMLCNYTCTGTKDAGNFKFSAIICKNNFRVEFVNLDKKMLGITSTILNTVMISTCISMLQKVLVIKNAVEITVL